VTVSVTVPGEALLRRMFDGEVARP